MSLFISTDASHKEKLSYRKIHPVDSVKLVDHYMTWITEKFAGPNMLLVLEISPKTLNPQFVFVFDRLEALQR